MMPYGIAGPKCVPWKHIYWLIYWLFPVKWSSDECHGTSLTINPTLVQIISSKKVWHLRASLRPTFSKTGQVDLRVWWIWGQIREDLLPSLLSLQLRNVVKCVCGEGQCAPIWRNISNCKGNVVDGSIIFHLILDHFIRFDQIGFMAHRVKINAGYTFTNMD